jgi:hypothetical protein
MRFGEFIVAASEGEVESSVAQSGDLDAEPVEFGSNQQWVVRSLLELNGDLPCGDGHASRGVDEVVEVVF